MRQQLAINFEPNQQNSKYQRELEILLYGRIASKSQSNSISKIQSLKVDWKYYCMEELLQSLKVIQSEKFKVSKKILLHGGIAFG